MAKKYKIEHIDNLEDFVHIVETIKKENEGFGNNSDLLFRGQREDFPLLPKLARLKLKGNIINIEKLILAEFKKSMLPLTEFLPENDWDVMALAQHHGLPTRLLDWTYSALTALWFSVCLPAIKDNNKAIKNGVVWVLAANVEDFRTNTDEIDPLSNKITKIFRPRIVSRRISAQSGVFTIHQINEEKNIIPFELHVEYSHKLTKIIVSGNIFSNIRKSLSILGVNNFTVFPDLEGLCKNLEWRFSKFDDEII